MDIKYNEFIGFYENVYEDDYCDHLISEFDLLQEKGVGANRIASENAKLHDKDDYQIGLSLRGHNITKFDDKNTVDVFFEGLQKCYLDYVNKFSILGNVNIIGSTMKMQKTGPGGGYHIWHSEQGPGEFSSRVLVYMLYLNDLNQEDGGETEFLYQRLRVQPKKNTMIIWPASFTHTHRGNIVLSNKYKYTVTGWFYYSN